MYECNIMTCHGVDVPNDTFVEFEHTKKIKCIHEPWIRTTNISCRATLEICICLFGETYMSIRFPWLLTLKQLACLFFIYNICGILSCNSFRRTLPQHLRGHHIGYNRQILLFIVIATMIL